MSKEKAKKIFKKGMPIITVLALVVAGYFYYQTTQLKKSPQAVVAKETKEVVSKVSKLVSLPDEQPTIATVADPEVLKDQAFFAKAQKGDKVLIYTNAKKAILYSVTLNKILDIAPLNIGNNGVNQTTTQAESTADTAADSETEN